MKPIGSSDRVRRGAEYYPWWLDNLADDATGEGAAMQGIVHGAEAVRTIVSDARKLYEGQEFHFTGDYGDNGFLEEYTCRIHGEPTSVVVTVKRNAAGQAEHLVVNHRPRSSVLLFARLMGEKYAGTPFAKYFIANEREKDLLTPTGT
ncbi:MAG TPA: hypothetical protein VKE96_15035 [Vicinamibacterales bacterium]|nr:hypothetical protein [Vicinamibacterales bacterium]